MVTDEERREIARKLREIDTSDDPLSNISMDVKIEEVIGVREVADPWPTYEWCLAHNQKYLNRLADLIDPDPDLTCELEPTASERTDAPVRVYECDCCGRSCDSVYAEDYVYCPFCGRLNTAREVEVEP